jgi:hypothetical protein
MVRILVAFISTALVILAFFAYPVVIQIYLNAPYTASIKPESLTWSLKKINEEEWRPLAHFRYQAEGHSYEKEELFQGEAYRNPYVGQEALQGLNEKYPLVWYVPEHPEKASLEKYFPLKRAIYCGIVFVLLSYGVFGGSYYTSYWLRHHKP